MPRPHRVHKTAQTARPRALRSAAVLLTMGLLAAGVLLLALLLTLTGETLARSSAVRAVLLFSANGMAAAVNARASP